ncbi:MAG: TVP38/TMEM64 family protein [Phycisphaerae bacterium]
MPPASEPNPEAEPPGKVAPPARRSGVWRLVVLGVVVVGLAVASYLLPVRPYLERVLRWTESLGEWGLLVAGGIYIPATVLFVPGLVLTVGAGFLYPLWLAVPAMSVGSTLGACAAFLVGRTVARGWVARKVKGRPKFEAIDDAVGREGFKIVLLTRLSPVFPFNLLNYAYGLTRVPFWKYALASWVGMLPGTLMYAYIGSGLRSLAEVTAETSERSTLEQVFFWVGLVIAVGVVVVVTRVARKALKRATDERLADEQEDA